MTTKTELQKQVDELKAQIDAMPDDKPIIKCGRAYEPLQVDEKYYYVDGFGGVICTRWDGCAIDYTRLESGNVFLTEQAAQIETDSRKLWQACRKAMRDAWNEFGEKPDWDNLNQQKRVIYLLEKYVQISTSSTHYAPIHFPPNGSIEAWLSTVTDEQIKLMLDVVF